MTYSTPDPVDPEFLQELVVGLDMGWLPEETQLRAYRQWERFSEGWCASWLIVSPGTIAKFALWLLGGDDE